MRFYADLHIHSKYSRATSKDCDLENLAYWGRKKGITVIGTGDFTHPAWIGEIKDKLVPAETGLFRLRDDIDKEVAARVPPSCHGTTRFMLSVEISTIYKKGDKTRKIHHLIYAPTIEKAEKLNQKLERIGNIRSDGRPILGLDSRHLLEIVLETGDDCYLVPAHIWTPWFAVLGSKSGFDSVTECYGDLAEHIFAVETGLSSDPEMNWRISGLDRYRLVSNSDAHSPPKLGREACVFETDLDYFEMRLALETGDGYGGTVEFFPEEGKYHMDGHRKCGVCLSPEESRAHDGLCPVCNKPLTLGVMYRVQELADRACSEKPASTDEFVSLVPLPEMISETEKVGPKSKTVVKAYESLLHKLGSELDILNDIPLDEIQSSATSSLIPEAISRMREGNVIREPGFDGEYGRIKLFHEDELNREKFTSILFDFDDDEALTPNSAAHKPPTQQQATTPVPRSKQQDKTAQIPADDLVLRVQTPMTVGLDAAQQSAVEITRGPVLIVAGPGSGKTKVLTHRVAHLITAHGVRPEQCLTITFTRRAAEELRQRLRTLLPNQCTQVPVTTFHGLGLQILQQNRVAAGLARGFRIASDTERRTLLITALDISGRKAKKLLQEISRTKRNRKPTSATLDVSDAVALLARERETRGWLDYDDLMVLSLGLLESDAGLRAAYRERYPWLSIDEYQDIDDLQYGLIQQLVPHDGNICAIGDPDQAIYGFRGADVGFFLRFQRAFPSAKRIPLTRNYRSSVSIVSASAQMIAPATLVEDREMQSLLHDWGKVVIHEAASDRAEAEFVVHTIEQMIGGLSFFSLDSERTDGDREGGYSFADFGVLYRTDAQGDVLEQAFSRLGIPFQRHAHKCLSEHPVVQTLLETLNGQDLQGGISDRLLQAKAEIETADIEQNTLELITEKLLLVADRCETRWEQFLSEIHLGLDVDIWDDRAARCSLLTLHAAKGLEFQVVFIVGCEDGLLPLRWNDSLSDLELAEERRLFFVGMTRAQRRLFLSRARKRFWQGQVRERQASPFLQDIEQRLLEMSRQAVRSKKAVQQNPQLQLF